MRIDDFKSNVGGIARTNRYKVVFANPTLLKGFDARKIQFFTKEVNLPGRDLRGAEFSPWGCQEIHVMNSDVDSIPITFLCDADMKLRKAFIAWIDDHIFDGAAWTVGYRDDYVTDIFVNVYNGQDELVDKSRIYGAFPRSVGDTTLSWENNDAPFEFTVTFSYYYWKPEPI